MEIILDFLNRGEVIVGIVSATIFFIYGVIYKRLQIKKIKTEVELQESRNKKELDIFKGEPYKALSKMHEYRFENLNEESNSMLVKILSVFSIEILESGNHTLKTYRYSSGKIKSFYASNNSKSMDEYGVDSQRGRQEIELKNTLKGDKKFYCFDGEQENVFGARQTINTDEGNLVNATLRKYLNTDRHDFAGTKQLYPAENVRLFLYFEKKYFPNEISVIKIDAAGNEMRHNCLIDRVSEKNLWIIEDQNVEKEISMYAIWKWPEPEVVSDN